MSENRTTTNTSTTQPINVVFDGPPGPEPGRFVEVELDDGRGVRAGEWVERPDGLWALRITALPPAEQPATTGARPSHQLPAEIFNAILELEGQVRYAAGLAPENDPDEFMAAIIETGRARDTLAQLLLDAGVSR